MLDNNQLLRFTKVGSVDDITNETVGCWNDCLKISKWQ